MQFLYTFYFLLLHYGIPIIFTNKLKHVIRDDVYNKKNYIFQFMLNKYYYTIFYFFAFLQTIIQVITYIFSQINNNRKEYKKYTY